MNNIFFTNIALLYFDYRYGKSVCLSQVPCVQLAADAVIARLKAFYLVLWKLNFVDRLWTIIKFKCNDVVIKAILIWICPISFNNNLRFKMHQFAHRFLKNFPTPPCWGGGKPLDAFGISVRRLRRLMLDAFSRPTFKTIPTPMR